MLRTFMTFSLHYDIMSLDPFPHTLAHIFSDCKFTASIVTENYVENDFRYQVFHLISICAFICILVESCENLKK